MNYAYIASGSTSVTASWAPRRNRRRLRPASKTPVCTRQTGLFES
jgi:hypothetical protein